MPKSNSTDMSGDLRRHPRFVHNGMVRMSWEDPGGTPSFMNGRCVDISEYGMKVATPEPVRIRGPVQLRSERMGFSGSGIVRHCVRFGGKYIVGIEFTSRVILPRDGLQKLPSK